MVRNHLKALLNLCFLLRQKREGKAKVRCFETNYVLIDRDRWCLPPLLKTTFLGPALMQRFPPDSGGFHRTNLKTCPRQRENLTTKINAFYNHKLLLENKQLGFNEKSWRKYDLIKQKSASCRTLSSDWVLTSGRDASCIQNIEQRGAPEGKYFYETVTFWVYFLKKKNSVREAVISWSTTIKGLPESFCVSFQVKFRQSYEDTNDCPSCGHILDLGFH